MYLVFASVVLIRSPNKIFPFTGHGTKKRPKYHKLGTRPSRIGTFKRQRKAPQLFQLPGKSDQNAQHFDASSAVL